MNSTDVFWDINGVSLQTYAYNVSTWGESLQAPPPLRGTDIVIPYRPGEMFTARRPSGRSMTFTMWVQGSELNGTVPTSRTMRAVFEENFKKLRSLFWNQGRQFSLTRRWRDPLTGTLEIATAKAVFANGLAPSMQGNTHATFTAEVYLSDPFFYGSEKNINFTAGTTSVQNVIIPGDYETTAITIDFNGARNNPRITNSAGANYVNLQQNLASGQLARLNVNAWTARKNPSSDNTNIIGAVTNFGHEFWMALQPGPNTLTLSGSSGTGTAVLKYSPRWL